MTSLIARVRCALRWYVLSVMVTASVGAVASAKDFAESSVAGASAQTSAASEGPSGEPNNVLQEVVISVARQRHESAQTTPVADTVLTSAALEQAHATDITQIATLAPNLQINHVTAQADAISLFLRGFGVVTNDPATDPHVALYVDGIYQPAAVGSLLDMYDIAQVEVLGGPQGTLLGRNAPIGAVYVTSQRPTGEWGVDVEADYGRFQHLGVRAKFNFPIIEGVLAGKLAMFSKKGGNWINDLTNGEEFGGEDVKGGRLSFAFTPTDALRWDLVGTAIFEHQPNAVLRNIDAETPYVPGSYYNATQTSVLAGVSLAPGAPPLPSNVPMGNCLLFYQLLGGGKPCPIYPYGTTGAQMVHASSGFNGQIASTISYRFDPVTLTAVTGMIKYWGDTWADGDGTPFPGLEEIPAEIDYEQQSQELRLASNKGGGLDLNGKLDWLVGAYVSNFHYFNSDSLYALGAPVYEYEHGRTVNWAEFAHAIYYLTEPWSVSAGIRYTTDIKFHNYRPNGVTGVYFDPSLRFTNTSFEAGSQYQIDRDRMVYVRFAEGYEAGGFVGLPAGPGLGSSYRPETNKAWEVGIKSDWLDKRLRVNFSLFTNDISNLQVSTEVPVSVAPGYVQATVNSGKAKVSGAELAIAAVPVDSLTLRMNGGFLHTKYDEYVSTVCANGVGQNADCAGVPFAYAPKWTFDVGGEYRLWTFANGINATLIADYNYRSQLYTGDTPVPISFQPGYGLFNATLRLGLNDKYSLELYGTNIFDKKYKVSSSIASGIASVVLDGPPAMWGVRVAAKLR